MDIPQLIFLFICWWKIELFLVWARMKKLSWTFLCKSFLDIIFFNFREVCRSRIASSRDRCTLNFIRNRETAFQYGSSIYNSTSRVWEFQLPKQVFFKCKSVILFSYLKTISGSLHTCSHSKGNRQGSPLSVSQLSSFISCYFSTCSLHSSHTNLTQFPQLMKFFHFFV